MARCNKNVQIANFGRELRGRKDVLPGYRLLMMSVYDPQVIALSGESNHPNLEPSSTRPTPFRAPSSKSPSKNSLPQIGMNEHRLTMESPLRSNLAIKRLYMYGHDERAVAPCSAHVPKYFQPPKLSRTLRKYAERRIRVVIALGNDSSKVESLAVA